MPTRSCCLRLLFPVRLRAGAIRRSRGFRCMPSPAPRMLPWTPCTLASGPDVCLLLHGLTGAPAELRPVGEALARAGFRAVGPLLPGHGGKAEDLYTVTRHDLIRAAEEALLGLAGARRVFICGL